MESNVVFLGRKPPEIAQYIRVGSFHHQCEELIVSGKMKSRRFVLDAGLFKRQEDLVRTLRDESAEVVLDTNAAELSVKGKFGGAAKGAPWALPDRPLNVSHFLGRSKHHILALIAEFVVLHKFSACLAPTHFLGDDQFSWFRLDLDSCIALRRLLDMLGGESINIDYPLIISYAQLRDPEFRKTLVSGLQNAPFERLWLRISGFGADATGQGIQKYVLALEDFQQLKRPVITDYVSGMAALSISCFGASSGFAHGIQSKERFSAAGWVRPTGSESGGGGGKTVFIPVLDRRLKVSEAQEMFDASPTARAILGCRDRSICCENIGAMLRFPEAHDVMQRERQVHELSATPESLRLQVFLDRYVSEWREKASRSLRLEKIDEEMKKKLKRASDRLVRAHGALWNLYDDKGVIEGGVEARFRRAGVVLGAVAESGL